MSEASTRPSRSSGTSGSSDRGRVAAGVGHEPRARDAVAVDLGQAVRHVVEQLGRGMIVTVPLAVGGGGPQPQVAGEVDDGRLGPLRPQPRRETGGDAVGQGQQVGLRAAVEPRVVGEMAVAGAGGEGHPRRADARRAGGPPPARCSRWPRTRPTSSFSCVGAPFLPAKMKNPLELQPQRVRPAVVARRSARARRRPPAGRTGHASRGPRGRTAGRSVISTSIIRDAPAMSSTSAKIRASIAAPRGVPHVRDDGPRAQPAPDRPLRGRAHVPRPGARSSRRARSGRSSRRWTRRRRSPGPHRPVLRAGHHGRSRSPRSTAGPAPPSSCPSSSWRSWRGWTPRWRCWWTCRTRS